MINGDKIRAMSDEQLTEFFENILKRLNEVKESVHVRSRNCCDISAAQGKVYAYEDAIGIVADAIDLIDLVN
jgi:hypothetical protein